VGAVPGPASFGRGGKEATITDASLLCGILDPRSYFGGDLALDADRAATAVHLNIAKPLGLSLDEALLQMEHAYEEKVAIELHRFTKISKETKLLAFGGAGPLNACGVAEKAGIDTVAVPKMAAVFSAYGIGECDISHHYSATLHQCTDGVLQEALQALQVKASRDMFAEGFAEGSYAVRARLVASMGGKEVSHDLGDSAVLPDIFKKVDVLELELSAVKELRSESQKRAQFTAASKAVADGKRSLLTKGQGRVEVPVYQLAKMKSGDSGVGPAIIEEDFFTCRVLDGWSFVISDAGDILLTRKG
jgi:N-methylhydantoinase A/oxoprolinase/acetone carboxylase beta subunit